MRNRGLRRPGLNALICLAMFIGGSLSVWFGAMEMAALGHETGGTAAKIGLGLLGAILGFLFFFHFLWGMRVVAGMRRGDDALARWTVAPATFDMFRELDRRLGKGGAGNDYKVPRKTPPTGLEVIFSADGVLVGDAYFSLASTGLARFRGVQMLRTNPPCLEFGTVLTTVVNLTVTRLQHTPGILRVPVAHNAGRQAAEVLSHFQDVMARRTIVKPDFWRRRVRIGLIAAVVCAIVAAAGFSLREMNTQLANVPLFMAVAGTVSAIGGLVLAFIAWSFSVKQHRG